MGLASGVHHLAISTADMKAQLSFFTDVLGAELKALYWMHGVPGAQHGFVKLNDSSYVAFVQMPAIADIPSELGVTHAGSGAGTTAAGTMQHVAFNVDSLDDLLALRDRIRDRGINVFGPLDHGMCHSIYFAGPEGLSLEIATSAVPIDDRAWIDPEVVALCGIDDDELAAMRTPADVRGRGRPGAEPADRLVQAAPGDGQPGVLRQVDVDARRGRDGQAVRERAAGARRRPPDRPAEPAGLGPHSSASVSGILITMLRWARPSTTLRRAPGTSDAVCAAWATSTIESSRPCSTIVGACTAPTSNEPQPGPSARRSST